MPTTTISTIARTNTIEEWRIQTNQSASDLNDLGFYTYDKNQGTLIISNTASLSITANGTPLQVSNNVLFQADLTLANNLLLGVVGSATGNIIAGGTISVQGPGRSLTVANNALVKNLEISSNLYVSNVSANNYFTVGNNLTVGGTLRLTGSGNNFWANTGTMYVQNLETGNIYGDYVETANINSTAATLSAIESNYIYTAEIRSPVANLYYLRGETSYSNTGIIRNFTANQTANIVTLSSNVATINTATVTNISSQLANVTGATIGTLFNQQYLQANVINANTTNSTFVGSETSNVSTLNANTANVTLTLTRTANVGTLNANTGNVSLTLTRIANVGTLNANTGNITNLSGSTLDTSRINVSSTINVATGGSIVVSAAANTSETMSVKGTSSFQEMVVEANLVVRGTTTQLGAVVNQNDTYILNDNTPVNKNAYFVNNRASGLDAKIVWDESVDWWKISRGNTYVDVYGILDASFLDSSVSNAGSSNVATSLAVNTAHSTAQTVGRYANSGYLHANAAFTFANTSNTYYAGVDAVQNTSITITGLYANAAYLKVNSAADYANAAFDAANGAYQSGGVVAGGYANAAYAHANSGYMTANSAQVYANAAFRTQNTTGSYANSAYTTANSAVAAAAIADVKAVTSGTYANAAYAQANTANTNAVNSDQKAVSAGSYANSAYSLANTKFNTSGGTFTGDVTVDPTRRFTSNNAYLMASKLGVGAGFLTLSADILQTASPSATVGIEVDRGTSTNVSIRWNEESDKWQFTNNGVDFITLGDTTAPATALAGGVAYSVPYQTSAGVTTFTAAGIDGYYLKYTAGVGIGWSAVPNPDLTNLSATYLTSGTVPSARLSGTYNINISGSASSATTAGSVTNGVYTTGNQTIGGTKTFESKISGNITGNCDGTAAALVTTNDYRVNSFGVGTAASGTTGEIRATNNITAYYASDKKFKENVKPIESALEKVNAIGGKTFDWTDEYIKEHGGEDDYFLRKQDFGVIAQDVQKAFPQAVRTRSDGTLAVDYEKLSALAFAAICELTGQVQELKKKLGE